MKKIKPVASKGNELQTLEALRDVLAETIDNCESGRDIAALSRQLAQVLERISELKKGAEESEGSSLDAIRAKLRVIS